jgi:hypothetical protein
MTLNRDSCFEQSFLLKLFRTTVSTKERDYLFTECNLHASGDRKSPEARVAIQINCLGRVLGGDSDRSDFDLTVVQFRIL